MSENSTFLWCPQFPESTKNSIASFGPLNPDICPQLFLSCLSLIGKRRTSRWTILDSWDCCFTQSFQRLPLNPRSGLKLYPTSKKLAKGRQLVSKYNAYVVTFPDSHVVPGTANLVTVFDHCHSYTSSVSVVQIRLGPHRTAASSSDRKLNTSS